MRTVACSVGTFAIWLLVPVVFWPGSLAADENAPVWELGTPTRTTSEEYRITWRDRTPLEELPAAWHAANRAQGSQSYFTPHGIQIVQSTDASPEWTWGVSLVAYGRGERSHVVEPARLVPDENRILLDRREIQE